MHLKYSVWVSGFQIWAEYLTLLLRSVWNVESSPNERAEAGREMNGLFAPTVVFFSLVALLPSGRQLLQLLPRHQDFNRCQNAVFCFKLCQHQWLYVMLYLLFETKQIFLQPFTTVRMSLAASHSTQISKCCWGFSINAPKQSSLTLWVIWYISKLQWKQNLAARP